MISHVSWRLGCAVVWNWMCAVSNSLCLTTGILLQHGEGMYLVYGVLIPNAFLLRMVHFTLLFTTYYLHMMICCIIFRNCNFIALAKHTSMPGGIKR